MRESGVHQSSFTGDDVYIDAVAIFITTITVAPVYICKRSFDLHHNRLFFGSFVHSSLPFNPFPRNSLGKEQASCTASTPYQKHYTFFSNFFPLSLYLSVSSILFLYVLGICVLTQIPNCDRFTGVVEVAAAALRFVQRNSNEFQQILIVGIVVANRIRTLSHCVI